MVLVADTRNYKPTINSAVMLVASWKSWSNQSLFAFYAERVNMTSSMSQLEPLERLHIFPARAPSFWLVGLKINAHTKN